MAILSFAAALLLAFSTVSARKCQDIVVPVTISARNGVFNLTTPQTNIDVTNFILNSVLPGHNGTQEVLTGYDTVSGTYQLQTTFCQPDSTNWRRGGSPSGENVVQLLTHGIGFDRTYWDHLLPIP
jgi:hypothetical protein